MAGIGRSGTLGRLNAWLAKQGLRAGDRLPAERDLCAALGVSRSELRKALAVLEIQGALSRQVGHGTYLRDSGGGAPEGGVPLRPGTASGPLSDVAGLASRTSPHEAMMARFAVEPELAGLAAIHATPMQLAQARGLAQEMRGAVSWEHYERLDTAFHQALAEASGNSLLAELHRILNAVRVSVVWPRLDVPADGPPPDYHSFAEHDAILAALDRRDRPGATEAMRAHLKSTRATLVSEG